MKCQPQSHGTRSLPSISHTQVAFQGSPQTSSSLANLIKNAEILKNTTKKLYRSLPVFFQKRIACRGVLGNIDQLQSTEQIEGNESNAPAQYLLHRVRRDYSNPSNKPVKIPTIQEKYKDSATEQNENPPCKSPSHVAIYTTSSASAISFLLASKTSIFGAVVSKGWTQGV